MGRALFALTVSTGTVSDPSCHLPGCADVPWLGQVPFQRAATPLGREEGCCQHLRAGRQQRAELCLLPQARRILFTGTGSLTEDMEKQLQANSIRIRVLEQENARLRSTLAKVKVAAEQGVLKVRLHPSQGELGDHGGEGWTCQRGAAYPKTTPRLLALSHILWGPVPRSRSPAEKALGSKRPWGILHDVPCSSAAACPACTGLSWDKAASRRA